MTQTSEHLLPQDGASLTNTRRASRLLYSAIARAVAMGQRWMRNHPYYQSGEVVLQRSNPVTIQVSDSNPFPIGTIIKISNDTWRIND